MRISDWSSDVCSSDLFESSPPFGPWAATEVSTGIGSTVALSLEQPAIVSVSRTAPILQIDMPDMALICPKAAGDCQRILCLHGPRRQLPLSGNEEEVARRRQDQGAARASKQEIEHGIAALRSHRHQIERVVDRMLVQQGFGESGLHGASASARCRR